MPSVIEVQVVVGNGDFIECRNERPIEGQVRTGASIGLLRFSDDAQNCGRLASKYARAGESGR